MAIDTIGLKSPYITEQMARKIESECIKRVGIDLKTNDLMYEITTGFLNGSHDSRISIKILREEWRSIGQANTIKMACEPYIHIEGSVHKAMAGFNIYGGPISFINSAKWMINLVKELINMEMPDINLWKVVRIDVSEVYELPSYEACQEWFRGLNSAVYPRRKVNRYDVSGLYASGTTTATKFYHKGPEFAKHDRKRLIKILDREELEKLQQKANNIIRVEVEIRPKKLKYDFGYIPNVNEISTAYLERVHDTEVERILKEGVSTMKIVRSASNVEKRLYDIYNHKNSNMAGVLLGFWFRMSAMGEDVVKKSVPKATFYKYRKLLKEAGCAWTGTDVILKEFSLVPSDFVPIRNDIRRLTGELPVITEKFRLYKTA